MSKLSDNKLKKVFINNFFKTSYFQELDLDKYELRNYDYHQLCFIFKFSPESMLYGINKFNEKDDFVDCELLKKFFSIRYKKALENTFYEEQLYFYFAIKILGFDEILDNFNELVIETKNQILISYYLKDKKFTEVELNKLKENDNEEYWFQNYHLILYCDEMKENIDENINKYLMPRYATKERQRESYANFYKLNLENNISIIRNIEGTYDEVQEYLHLKIEENRANFQSED